MKQSIKPNLEALTKAEHQQVRKDLIKVLLLNGLLLVLMLVLFFVNQKTGQVDSFFASVLKF